MRWPQGCPAARSHPASGASTVCLTLTGYSQLSGWALVERALVRITRVKTVKTVKRYQKRLPTIGHIKERRKAAVACQSKQNQMNPCANSVDHRQSLSPWQALVSLQHNYQKLEQKKLLILIVERWVNVGRIPWERTLHTMIKAHVVTNGHQSFAFTISKVFNQKLWAIGSF